MAQNLFARSPFIVLVTDPFQTGSKVELRFGSPVPLAPDYSLDKLIPASNNVDTYYNISPYVLEYFNFDAISNNYSTDWSINTGHHVHVQVDRFELLSGIYTPAGTFNYVAFGGYGYFEDGANPSLGNIMLDEKNYYYWHNSGVTNPVINPSHRAGTILARVLIGSKIRYTGLVSGTVVTTLAATGTNVYNIYRVKPAFYAEGNLVEILDALNNVIWSSRFIPMSECRYDPVTIDFVNRYGGFQREFFFKASFETLDVTDTAYNLMLDSAPNAYNYREGQRSVFNKNGQNKFKLNSGFVDESFGDTMQQILLSEHVKMSIASLNLPITVSTKTLSKDKHINKKLINYSIDVEMAYDTINSVI